MHESALKLEFATRRPLRQLKASSFLELHADFSVCTLMRALPRLYSEIHRASPSYLSRPNTRKNSKDRC